jgi:hypothetical protein
MFSIPFEEHVNGAIDRAKGDPNKVHHIFENPTHDHRWDVTGLDEAGNWDLIKDTLISNANKMEGTPNKAPIELEHNFGSYTVVVCCILIKGVLRISDSWIIP